MGKHFAAQRHESVGNGEKAGLKAIGAFSSVFLGVCSLAIGNVNAAETKSNETYQDAETLLVTGEKIKRSILTPALASKCSTATASPQCLMRHRFPICCA